MAKTEAKRVSRVIGDRQFSIETGKLAKQADGAVVISYGDTVVLVTGQSAPGREGLGFFPLTVDYREKQYAAGKIPGGIFKREGRPTTKEVLTMRLIDRPIRPLFPEGYRREVQVMATVLSADKENEPDVLAITGAGAALSVSSIPFDGPIAAVRMARVNGELVLFPTYEQSQESDLNLVVAGTKEMVTMVECFAGEMVEQDMLEAIWQGHEAVKTLCEMIEELASEAGKQKQEVAPEEDTDTLLDTIRQRYRDDIVAAHSISDKLARIDAFTDLMNRAVEDMCPAEGEAEADAPTASQISDAVHKIEGEVVREQILKEGRRYDGRSTDDIRNIECEVGVLPRTHGSALFTRGETQALVITTLGTTTDERRILDALTEEPPKKFMLHYNFPPFSVGEVKPLRGPSRREIGHGELAERALKTVLPPTMKFPYTIRIVSDIMESNGSSSMATVCGATLSLMDAGVPIKDPVAGVAMGLITDGKECRILTDIAGAEDHYGDMDFKIAGTQRGITAMQMDVKVAGVDRPTLQTALDKAKAARIEILRHMLQALKRPRPDISPYAPRLIQLQINPDKIGTVIGPGGKVVRRIQEETGAKIEIEDDGTVLISSVEVDGAERAAAIIESMTAEVEVGKIYKGRVVSIQDFGAFVEILPNQDGLCHISELDEGYVRKVDDVVQIGQEIEVKVIGIDDHDRIKLSRKAALKKEKRPRR